VDVDTTINITFADGSTSGNDFDHAPVAVTFLAGETTAQVILVATTADATVEANETLVASLALSVTLVGGRLSDTTDTGAGTINNDDTVFVTISDATAIEGGSLAFTVALSNPVDIDVTVNVSFTDGTTSASDFDHTPVPVTFLAGETAAEVILVAAIAGRFSDTADTATGEIFSLDTSTLSISSPTVSEGNSGTTALTFAVTSSNAVQGTFQVAFSIANVSADASDYTVVTVSPLTFSGGAGETQFITLAVNGDIELEDDETLIATLGEVTSSASFPIENIMTGATGTGTIANDDEPLVVTLPGPPIVYNAGGTPVAIDPNASEDDVDTPDYTYYDGSFDVPITAILTIKVAGGGDGHEQLGVLSQGDGAGNISILFDHVVYQSSLVIIGRISGLNSDQVTIEFTSFVNLNATIVDRLLQLITFSTTSDATPGDRQISFQFTNVTLTEQLNTAFKTVSVMSPFEGSASIPEVSSDHETNSDETAVETPVPGNLPMSNIGRLRVTDESRDNRKSRLNLLQSNEITLVGRKVYYQNGDPNGKKELVGRLTRRRGSLQVDFTSGVARSEVIHAVMRSVSISTTTVESAPSARELQFTFSDIHDQSLSIRQAVRSIVTRRG